jgi:hypothetical protein
MEINNRNIFFRLSDFVNTLKNSCIKSFHPLGILCSGYVSSTNLLQAAISLVKCELGLISMISLLHKLVTIDNNKTTIEIHVNYRNRFYSLKDVFASIAIIYENFFQVNVVHHQWCLFYFPNH